MGPSTKAFCLRLKVVQRARKIARVPDVQWKSEDMRCHTILVAFLLGACGSYNI